MSLIGIRLIESLCSFSSAENKRKRYSIWIWILTFLIYVSYHLSRKPISVVKNVLNENCSSLMPPTPTNDSHWCEWKPFDKEDSATLLGILDSVYLFAYAIGMFFSGFIAERMKLNVFLFMGMFSSSIFTALFGFGFIFDIHMLWYFLLIQMFCGLTQSTGWPGVVTAMGNWFGESRRGFIMGIWNSHTSVGNILGTVIADAFLLTNWGLSFIVPACIIGALGIITFFTLIPEPASVGLPNPNYNADPNSTEVSSSEETSLLIDSSRMECAPDPDSQTASNSTSACATEPAKPIDFRAALCIPGVVEFSLSLFFSKLVSYTFLYWLPHYIYDSTKSSITESGNISTFFDVGGIIGGIMAGLFTDYFHMPASTCVIMLSASIPLLFAYDVVSKTISKVGNIAFLIPIGIFVNGPYALITTAVSAELGNHPSLQRNSKALSTVTSIIDGTGSLGAAIGPLLAGIISSSANWDSVFYMLMGANVFSIICLLRIMKKEIKTRILRSSS